MNTSGISKLIMGAALLICALLVSCDTHGPYDPYPPSSTAFDYGFKPAETTITKAETVKLPDAPLTKWGGTQAELDDLYNTLYNGFINCETKIDVRRFGIPYDYDVMSTLRSCVDVNSIAECLHMTEGYGFLYEKTSGGDIITYVEPYYDCTPDEYREYLAKCRQATDQILSGIIGNDDLSDVDKALLIHDRLALWCEYDTRAEKNAEPLKSHRIRGALVDGVAVCDGYAYAYSYLLNQVGIKNNPVDSNELNHRWNVVYIDGTPYHVDVTWDDPVSDITGRVDHTYFLRSEEAMRENGHDAGDYSVTGTATTYDNAYWQSSQAAFQYLNGALYYIDSDAEILYCRENDKSVKVLSVASEWLTSETMCYRRQARLSYDGVNLLYSQPDGVYAYNLTTKKTSTIWKPDLSMGKYYAVYGFTYRDGQLICDIYNDANFPRDGAGVIEDRRAYAPS